MISHTGCRSKGAGYGVLSLVILLCGAEECGMILHAEGGGGGRHSLAILLAVANIPAGACMYVCVYLYMCVRVRLCVRACVCAARCARMDGRVAWLSVCIL